jgi:hypothetical protein
MGFQRFFWTLTLFGVGKLLIDMDRAEDLRIRNAWVRGSNPLCAPDSTTKNVQRRPPNKQKTLRLCAASAQSSSAHGTASRAEIKVSAGA